MSTIRSVSGLVRDSDDQTAFSEITAPGNVTLFVNPDPAVGDNANDGLTAASPFLTVALSLIHI